MGKEHNMLWEELKNEALQLAPEQRAQLAHALLSSLENLSAAEIEALWIEEAIRRDEEIDVGKVVLRPADKVLQDARSRRR
jgi:hypothetical protein